MRLGNTLKEVKTQFISAADPAAVETMQRATRELEVSGIIDRVLKVEDRALQFTLKDERGVGFALSDFLSRGPVILHFFRGFW